MGVVIRLIPLWDAPSSSFLAGVYAIVDNITVYAFATYYLNRFGCWVGIVVSSGAAYDGIPRLNRNQGSVTYMRHFLTWVRSK